jgi:Large polyvalent protein associated domain 38
MPYKLPLPDGRSIVFPDDYPREKADALLQRYLDKKYPKTPGPVAQFFRSAGLGAAPTAAGIAAFGPSAAIGAPLGGIGGIATGLIGSTAAALATSFGQEKLLEAAPELAKTLGVDPETMARGAEANPVADTLGLIAPMAVAFKPSSPFALFRKPKGETPEAIEAALKARRGERIAATAGAGLGGGIDAAMQLAGDAPFDPVQAAMMAGAGAIFRDPNRLGRRLLGASGMGPFARPTPEATPEGEAPPSPPEGEAPPPEGEAPPPPPPPEGEAPPPPPQGEAPPPPPEGEAPPPFSPEAEVAAREILEKAAAGTRYEARALRKVLSSLGVEAPKLANSKQLLKLIAAAVNRPKTPDAEVPPAGAATTEAATTEVPPAGAATTEVPPAGAATTEVPPAGAAAEDPIVRAQSVLDDPDADIETLRKTADDLGLSPEKNASKEELRGIISTIVHIFAGETVAPAAETVVPKTTAPEAAAETVVPKTTAPETTVPKTTGETVTPAGEVVTPAAETTGETVTPAGETTVPKTTAPETAGETVTPAAKTVTPAAEFIAKEAAAEAAAKKAAEAQAAAKAAAKKAANSEAKAREAAEEAKAKPDAKNQKAAEAAAKKAAEDRAAADAAAKKAADEQAAAEAAGREAAEARVVAQKAADDAADESATDELTVARAETQAKESADLTAPLVRQGDLGALLDSIAIGEVTPVRSRPSVVGGNKMAQVGPEGSPLDPYNLFSVIADRLRRAVRISPESVKIASAAAQEAEATRLGRALTKAEKSRVTKQAKRLLSSRIVAEGNKLSAEDAAVIARLKQEGKLAEYDPKTNTFYYTNEGMTPKTVLHETIHAVSLEVLRAYKKGGKLTDVERFGAKRINDIFEKSKPLLGGQFKNAYENVYEFLTAALTDGDFQRALSRVRSEDLGITFAKAKEPNAWSRITSALAKMFGLDRYAAAFKKPLSPRARDAAQRMDNALLQVADAFEDVLRVPRPGIDMAPLPSRKTAPPASGNRTVDQMTRDLSDDSTTISTREKLGRPFNMGREALKQFTRKGIQQFVKLFQNVQVYAKDLQKALRAAGINTRIYDVLSSLGSETQIRWMASQGIRQGIDSALGRYMSKLGLDENGVYKRLHMLAIGASERELRQVLFMQKVPLSRAADARRIKILDDVSKGVSEQQAIAFRKELDALIAKDIATDSAERVVRGQLQNLSDDALSIESKLYNGVGEYTKEELQSLRDFYQKEFADSPEIRELFDPKNGLFKQLKDYTIKNNKEAGFHPDQLDSLLAFYGRANYMPFKGTAGVAYADEVEALNYGSTRLGGRATELQNKQEGRQSDSNNPFLQLISDAAKSASRIGTSNLVDEVIALSKFMPDKIRRVEASDVNFNQRYMANTQREDLNAKDRIFRHRANGELEIWEVKDPELLEAVKGFIDDPKIGWQALNKVTSTIASFHTRYNPAFPVYNFVRDAITSGGIVGAELGAGVGVRYASSVVSQITNGGLLKAGKVARLFQAGKLDEINKLAASGDEFYKSLANYINDGGVVTYQEAINTKSLQDELRKNLASQLGKKRFAKTKDNVVNAFDVWTNTFELATRAAGYDAILPEMVARRQQQLGRKLTAAERAEVGKETSQYVRQLFNYSEVGKYGREMGSFFMFMRPAMTGAVRFWEAFSPAFSSIESRMASVPKEVFDVPTVQKMLQEQAVARGEDVSGQAAKDALRASAEQEVAKRRDTYTKNFEQQQRSARIVSMAAAGAGFALYNMSLMMSDNDEMGRNKVLTDNMNIWQRNLRIPLPKDALGEGIDYLQIPWGFGFGAFAAFGSQIAAVTSGGQSFTDALENAIPIAIDSAFPVPAPQYSPFDNPGAFFTSLMLPSAVRPFVEYTMNVDAFGREIYQNRINQFGNPYTGGETLPEAYTLASSLLADIANQAGMDVPEFVTPKTLHFFANSYMDGIARLSASGVGLASALGGAREIDLKEDVLPFASFLGRSTSVDAREYADVRKEVANIARQLKILENYPEKLAGFLDRNPNAQTIVDYFNKQEYGRLRGVRERANRIRENRGLSISEKREMLRDLNFQRDWIMRNTMESIKAWM